jgi:hypothetical protein
MAIFTKLITFTSVGGPSAKRSLSRKMCGWDYMEISDRKVGFGDANLKDSV